jgi:hypothetical protein
VEVRMDNDPRRDLTGNGTHSRSTQYLTTRLEHLISEGFRSTPYAASRSVETTDIS